MRDRLRSCIAALALCGALAVGGYAQELAPSAGGTVWDPSPPAVEESATDVLLEEYTPEPDDSYVWVEEGDDLSENAAGEPGVESFDEFLGLPEGDPLAEVCLAFRTNQPLSDFSNISDNDRSVAVDVNRTNTVSALGFTVKLGRATNVRVDIRRVIGKVRQAPVLGTANKSFNAGPISLRTIPINFTFQKGVRYDIAFTATPGWGFDINTMRFVNFNNPDLDPNKGFNSGPFRVLDGGSNGNYDNTLMPLATFCDHPCPGTTDLRGPATNDQSTWGRPNTVIYAQSVVACNKYLEEVRMRATHTGGNDIQFNVVVTGSRLNNSPVSSSMGVQPNFADTRWTSRPQRITPGGVKEVTVNPRIGVNVGETYFIVFESFSHVGSGRGTMKTTPFNGGNDLYPSGEFVFANLTNQTKLTDFDSANYGHRNANKQDLGVRVVWTAGEAPRANVVDFQVLQHHDGVTKTHGDQYDEEGWRLTKPPSAQNFTTFGTQMGAYPQSTAMFSNTVNGLITLRKIDGGAFDMIQIKLAELVTPAKSPVNFVGFPKTGGQVPFNVVLDGIGPQNGLQTFNFPGSFRNLDRVEWRQVSTFHQFDDIVARPSAGNVCNGNEFFAKTKCKTRNGVVKKLIVLVKLGTPQQEYSAKLDTGQQLSKKAKPNGKVKFNFRGGNKPPCGANAVAISTGGNGCIRRAFNCGC